MRLVDPDPANGYARVVLSFTEHPESNTVTVISRAAAITELLVQGSMDTGGFALVASGERMAFAANGHSVSHGLWLSIPCRFPQFCFRIPCSRLKRWRVVRSN